MLARLPQRERERDGFFVLLRFVVAWNCARGRSCLIDSEER